MTVFTIIFESDFIKSAMVSYRIKYMPTEFIRVLGKSREQKIPPSKTERGIYPQLLAVDAHELLAYQKIFAKTASLVARNGTSRPLKCQAINLFVILRRPLQHFSDPWNGSKHHFNIFDNMCKAFCEQEYTVCLRKVCNHPYFSNNHPSLTLNSSIGQVPP